jgi:hypothetical protein
MKGTGFERGIAGVLAGGVVVAPIIGWLDFRASEVQGTVLLLVVAAAVLSYWAPRYAWLVALLVGLPIVETHFVALALGKTPPSATAAPTLLALIPAAIGAAVGAATRALTSRVSPS